MMELAQAFLVWLIYFGVVALGALITLHLVLRRIRNRQKASAAAGDSQATNGSTNGLSLSSRILITVIVGAVYVGILGPLVANVFSYLKASVPTQGSTPSGEPGGSNLPYLATAPMELDALGRPKLMPVPDPISAD
jgi:hypothetical protein